MRFEPLALDADGFAELIGELRFGFHKWDAYLAGSLRILPEALLLTGEEHRDVVAVSQQVGAALARVAAQAQREPGSHDRLAIPPQVRPLIEAERESPLQLARYDLIPTTAGWMIPEFNEDAPGGFNEAVAGRALFARALASGRVEGDFAQCFLDSLPPGRCCALVYATGYAEDLQHMLVLADLMRERGIEPMLVSPEQLTCGPFGKPRFQGVAIDWILRFFPGEWYAHIATLKAWRRAVARVPVLNPLTRLIHQSKGLYAWWRQAPGVDPADRDLLNRYTAHTEFLRAGQRERLLAERERWVLKQMFGRMGDAVLIGRRMTDGDWRKALDKALEKPQDWIMQHAFEPLSLATANGPRQYPALGAYLINGQFAGYYSRADEVGFTTHEAHYVVTAVEDS